MKGVLSAVVGLGALLCASAPSLASPPAATAHSREVAQIQARFADLVRLQGRELVIYDADGLVRPFGDSVLGRTWDTVPRNARGSFERIAEATGERRAFSMIVRTGGKVECRVGPTSPDQAWMNLLAAYSGQERTSVARERMRLTSALFQRFVLLHEVGHCVDARAFDRDRTPMRNVFVRHKAEGYSDTFALLELAAEGVDPEVLRDIVKVRALYMASSAMGAASERRTEGTRPSDSDVAGYEHVPYWNIAAMKAAIAMAPRMRGADARTVATVARAIIDADGVTPEELVRVHRALAKESGATEAEAEIAAADAEHALVRPAPAPGERTFDRVRWENEFRVRMQAAGASGEGPAALLASERDRLRAVAAVAGNPADAGALEEALGRLAELSMKGYASVSDPPLVVSSTGNSTGRIPVAAMPSRLDTVGPVPSQALKGALDAAAQSAPAARAANAQVAKPQAAKPQAAKGVVAKPPPARVAALPRQIPIDAKLIPAGRLTPVPQGKVQAQALPPAAAAKPDPIAELTGISPAMAKIRAEAAERRR